MHFARVLRSAGLPVGADRVHTALAALQVAGLESKADFHAVLSACLVDRREHLELFDQAFVLFWRDPDLMGCMRALLLPKVHLKDGATPPPENRRLGEALFPHQPVRPPNRPPDEPQQDQIQVDAQLTWSDRELLNQADFDTMTADEWRATQRLLQQMRWLFPPLPSRRHQAARRPGRPDWRATMAQMARHGGDWGAMQWRAPRQQPAPLVVLADISGSMSRYSRMLLHFAHALGHGDARVESFVFGTRLTRTTRLLKGRDPDLAIAQVVRAVADWSGGTRITISLHEFNQRWARRVLCTQATVLLISDGLEPGDTAALGFEMERLHKSCRRLLWLNPLLRFTGFEPRAGGIKAMLPHVDQLLPAHNLQSLADLAQALCQPAPGPRALR